MLFAMTFRPTLWATLVSLAVLAVLIGLGSWQLDRRVWKQQVLEARAQRINAPAIAMTDTATGADPGVLEYRPIRLQGRFAGARWLKLLSRTRDGRAGFHVIAPLAADGGVTVLVDRGWVPVDGAITSAPTGPVGIEGYLRKFETPGRFTPDNEAGTNAWFYLDRDQMASALELKTVAPFYVQQAPGAVAAGLYPAGAVPNMALRNPHLQYALTWYSLAVVLLVIYVVFHIRRRGDED